MKISFRVLSIKIAPNGSPREWICTLVAEDGTAYDVECGMQYNIGQYLEVPIEGKKPRFDKASAALGDIVNQSKRLKEAAKLYALRS